MDVSKSSHEEAIGVFQAAQEPILVQVLRRSSPAAAAVATKEVYIIITAIPFLMTQLFFFGLRADRLSNRKKKKTGGSWNHRA